MSRIVSLIPSGTEMVCALGSGSQLVGRSHECDFPPDIRHLPICTTSTVNCEGNSQTIHDQVSQRLRQTLSLYEVLIDLVKDLQPDVIVTQTQCKVCAVSTEEVQRSLHNWGRSSPTLISLGAQDLSGVWEDITRVAEGIGQRASGQRLLETAHHRIDEISQRLQQETTTPLVACIEWIDPLMAAGNWVPELVELAGGRSMFGEAGAHAPWITWEALLQADPEVILLMPCGFSISRIQQEFSTLTGLADWDKLRAVQTGKVYLTDGNQYFNRPGPRLVESLEILAEIFHPDIFHFGHQGQGWKLAAPLP
ncbi:MAG: cobalamin-binding protein [Nitrospirales bacterium]